MQHSDHDIADMAGAAKNGFLHKSPTAYKDEELLAVAHFILLLTATPFFNDIRDFMGYYKLFLPSNPEVTQRMSGPRIARVLDAVPQSTEQSILCSREFVEARVFGKDINSQVLP
ncbi:hypothetical protein AnigIFM50267_010129 [Aspergillus niger]|nr:hypothetical protein AnigIFM50267_010129 [Aspergillus niger]